MAWKGVGARTGAIKRRMGRLALLGIVLLGLLVGPLALGSPSAWAATELHWLEAEPSSSADFEKALAVRQWQFPQDFAAHEDYQSEWWYYTGNLETAEGRPFGFQLTFFRQALLPPGQPVSQELIDQESIRQEPGATASNWRGRQVYSAHFTISDIAEQQFYPYERFSRGRVGLAGAELPYRVWLEDWSATEVEPGTVRLVAKTHDVALDLRVQQTLPPVLQGNQGLSIKGHKPGNASYYYSLVQQPTSGSLTIHDKTYALSGLTWKDHEYSTSSLDPGTVGWDWFSMQFDNGSALMLYLLRQEDGTIEDTSAGTYIAPSGETTPIGWQDWQVQVLDTWKSPKNGAVYPAKWQIQIPKLNLSLQARAMMPNQELNVATATYWEGAVAFTGTQADQPLNGKGYVELTGYVTRLDTLLSARTP